MTHALCTGRLDLIPATRQILECDLNDRDGLARLLGARIAKGWPPPLMDEMVIAEFIRMCSDPKGPVFAAWYWVLDDPASPGRILIGNGGVLQADGRPETVVLGYSVLDEFQNHGYATEAVRALIPAIFSLPGITRIIATTYPELGASIRVLEKCGFTRSDRQPSGTGAEEGTVCFVRAKIKTKKV